MQFYIEKIICYVVLEIEVQIVLTAIVFIQVAKFILLA